MLDPDAIDPGGPIDPAVPDPQPVEDVSRPAAFTLMAPGWYPPEHAITQAYGFCFTDHSLVALVHTPDGFNNLPGGQLEPGETAGDALVREVAEEASASVTACRYLACQHVWDPQAPNGPTSHYQTRWWARVELEPWNPCDDEYVARHLVAPSGVLSTLSRRCKEIAGRLVDLAVTAEHDVRSTAIETNPVAGRAHREGSAAAGDVDDQTVTGQRLGHPVIGVATVVGPGTREDGLGDPGPLAVEGGQVVAPHVVAHSVAGINGCAVRHGRTAGTGEQPSAGDTERDGVRDRALDPHDAAGVAPQDDVELVDAEQNRPDDQGDRHRAAKVGRTGQDGPRLAPGGPGRRGDARAGRRGGRVSFWWCVHDWYSTVRPASASSPPGSPA